MGRKLLVSGGEQRTHAAMMHESHRYGNAVLVEVDVDTGQTRTRFAWQSPQDACPDDRPSFVFKAASLVDDRLYLCTQTEVIVLAWPSLEQLRYVSLPCFNDLHHVVPHGEDLLVVSTGLDALAVVGPDDSLVELIPALDEAPWSRFDPAVDYRKIASTKPHNSHPNYAFVKGGHRWMTRFAQHDAIDLDDRSRTIPLGDTGVHDGILHDGQVGFTGVSGRLVFADAETDAVLRHVDLNPLSGAGDPLGWCRGLHVEGNIAYVGFSRIRKTRIMKNLSWVKNRGRRVEARPTRIGVYDLAAGRHLRDIDLEPAGLSAVFSLLPV